MRQEDYQILIYRLNPKKELSKAQNDALDTVSGIFREKEIALLHGVTSSGKTEIYIHLIEEQLGKGKQVLYLLPEIGLTTQIIQRLNRHFSPVTGIYHSRFSNAEKVEIWNRVAGTDPGKEYGLIVGVQVRPVSAIPESWTGNC